MIYAIAYPSCERMNCANWLSGRAEFYSDRRRFKVQSPTSKVKNTESRQTLDIGPWTLDKGTNRRDALWQVERVVRPPGPLYQELHEADSKSPLAPDDFTGKVGSRLSWHWINNRPASSCPPSK